MAFGRGGAGELTLFLGNRLPTSAITNLQLVLPPPGHPAMQAVQVEVAGPVPPQLAPSRQERVTLAARCLGPIAEGPPMKLSFVIGERCRGWQRYGEYLWFWVLLTLVTVTLSYKDACYVQEILFRVCSRRHSNHPSHFHYSHPIYLPLC